MTVRQSVVGKARDKDIGCSQCVKISADSLCCEQGSQPGRGGAGRVCVREDHHFTGG